MTNSGPSRSNNKKIDKILHRCRWWFFFFLEKSFFFGHECAREHSQGSSISETAVLLLWSRNILTNFFPLRTWLINEWRLLCVRRRRVRLINYNFDGFSHRCSVASMMHSISNEQKKNIKRWNEKNFMRRDILFWRLSSVGNSIYSKFYWVHMAHVKAQDAFF